ncbi:MAG: hypothetical protein PQJ60_07585 [Spirochaetales bacterium]|nr:hypothetical protein [Spirochaetales bacterium]
MTYNVTDHDFGDTLSMAFKLEKDSIGYFLKNFFLFLLVSLVLGAILGALLGAIVGFDQLENFFLNFNENDMGSIFAVMGVMLLVMLPLLVLLGGIFPIIYIRRVSDIYLGVEERPSFQEELSRSLGRFFPLIGASLLMMLGVYGGFFLLIVPGVIFLLAWSVYANVLILEEATPVESLSRSWELTKQNRGKIFGLLFVVGLIFGGIYMVLSFLSLAVGTGGMVVVSLLQLIVQLFYYPLSMTLSLVIYYNLRVQKEGFAAGADRLAEEFGKPQESTDA